MSQLTQDNACHIVFTANEFFVKDSQGRMIAKGVKKGDLYALEELRHFALSSITNTASSAIWHHRLGHSNAKDLNFLQNKEFINISNWKKQRTICPFVKWEKAVNFLSLCP